MKDLRYQKWEEVFRAMGRAARNVVKEEVIKVGGEKFWNKHKHELFPRGQLQGKCKCCGSWVDIKE